ncbi:VOC family protein [Aeromonas rivuli]|uniref:VOC family protein n=1 Tax=Aeromonas rivuli TaxID=648794 RepID=UPI0005A64659|nr:VOC family protein [Aeromonas rivuli]
MGVIPCLWFDGQAQAAAELYTSLFPESGILAINHYPGQEADPPLPGTHRPAASVLTVHFRLEGSHYLALNGGPQFPNTPACSLVGYCDNQLELDKRWQALSEGGRADQCGWLQDRFGLSWQLVPRQLPQWLSGDPAASARVFGALMRMGRLDIATLQRAYEGNA